MTSRRNVSSVRRGADRSQTAGWLAACGGATRRVRARAQLHIGAAAGGANVLGEGLKTAGFTVPLEPVDTV